MILYISAVQSASVLCVVQSASVLCVVQSASVLFVVQSASVFCVVQSANVLTDLHNETGKCLSMFYGELFALSNV